MSDLVDDAVRVLEDGLAVAGTAEDVAPGQSAPIASSQNGDVAAVLFCRRRPSKILALSVVLLELCRDEWRLVAEAEDEWDEGQSEAALRWLGWVAGERDTGSATAVWGIARGSVTAVAAEGVTAPVHPGSGAFVIVVSSPSPGWYESGARRLAVT